MSEQEVFDLTEVRNGHTAATIIDRAAEPMMTRRMPVKVHRVQMTGDYEGWWAEMWLNPPVGLMQRWQQSEDPAGGTFEFMPHLIKAWNFGDADGNPLPITADGLRALPDDLIGQLSTGYQDARGLPKASPST